MLIRPGSLSQTVDAINAASYERAVLSAHDRKAAALWIVGRQGQPGAYADTFAGFPSERENTNPGLFCCGKCSVGLWRNLLAGGMNRQEERAKRTPNSATSARRRHELAKRVLERT